MDSTQPPRSVDLHPTQAPRPLVAPRSRRAHACALLAITFVFAALAALHRTELSPLSGAERWVYDRVLLRLIPPAPESGRVAIVDIDDASLADLGERWPLSRATWARVIDRLAAHEPAVIALDVVFDQPSESSALALGADVVARIEAFGLADDLRARRLAVWLEREMAELDADRRFSQALASAGTVVLAAIFVGDATAGPLDPSNVRFTGGADARVTAVGRATHPLALRATGVVGAHPQLAVSALGSGGINVLVHRDGVIRRYPYLVQIDDATYPSLALAAVIAGAATGAIDVDTDALVEALPGRDGAAPWLAWREPAAPFPRLSLADVLLADPPVDGSPLAGRVVFVGPSAVGVEPFMRTPTRERVPGVEIHATAADGLLLGTGRVAAGLPAWFSGLFALLALAAFAWLCWRDLRPLALLGAAGALLGLHVGAVFAAASSGWLLALTPLPIGVGALGLAHLADRWQAAKHERRALAARQTVLEAERNALDRFRVLVDHVADAIVTVDSLGRVSWLNRAAEELFLRRRDTSTGARIDAFIPAWSAGIPATPVEPGRRLPTPRDEMARLPNGDPLAVEITVTDMQIGEDLFANVVIRDVAHRKELERMRADFVSAVNHELRTPVTSIIGSLRLVEQGAAGEIDPSAARLVDIAAKNAERLLSLVNDLLDLARLEAGVVSYEQHAAPLAPLLTAAVEAIRGYAAEFGAEVTLDSAIDGVEVRCNGRRVEQVLTNLLSNAIKHSPTGGTVAVAASVVGDADAAERRVRVTVTDRGPGISPALRSQIFDKFVMTDLGDGRKRSGTGLGLAIAKAIVEDHGGTIGVDSELGAGSTFWFELPCLV